MKDMVFHRPSLTVRICAIIMQLASSYQETQLLESKKYGAMIGGEEALPHEFPYLVEIRFFDLTLLKTVHACSGVIIDREWILTAGHCTSRNPFWYQIVAGEHDNSPLVTEDTETKRRVARIFIPPGYRRFILRDDIALMQLNKPLEINEFIKPVALPNPGFEAKGMAVVAGWGTYEPHRVSSNVLMKIMIPIIPKDECQEMYGPQEPIFDTNLCAGTLDGKKDACMGNSGGGLFCKEDGDQSGNTVLCGILSWGSRGGNGCAIPRSPQVFTHVLPFLKWINETIYEMRYEYMTH